MKVDDIIRGIPELEHKILGFENLGGGLCNETYRVQTKHKAYVLRINSRQNEYLNLTRRSEIEVMKKAHREGFSLKSLPMIILNIMWSRSLSMVEC